MEYSDLPKDFKRLVEKRTQDVSNDVESISHRFVFKPTPEGKDFWWAVHTANSKKELPPFPEHLPPIADETFNKESLS